MVLGIFGTQRVAALLLVLYERLVLDVRFPQYPPNPPTLSRSPHTCSYTLHTPMLQHTPVTALLHGTCNTGIHRFSKYGGK
jgi:hypothetical protein